MPRHPSHKERAEAFRLKSNTKYGGKYEFPNLDDEYLTMGDEVTMICPRHGEVRVRPSTHMHHYPCHQCHYDPEIDDFDKQELFMCLGEVYEALTTGKAERGRIRAVRNRIKSVFGVGPDKVIRRLLEKVREDAQ